MKPKYLFYIVLIVIMHYEVSRLIEGNHQEEPDDVDQSSYQKGVRLDDTSNSNDIEFNYKGKEVVFKSVKELRITGQHHKNRTFKIW